MAETKQNYCKNLNIGTAGRRDDVILHCFQEYFSQIKTMGG